MTGFLILFSLASGTAYASGDSDAKRQVPEGQEIYTGKDLRVGGVYEGFVIRFQGRDQWFLSPSRFEVSYADQPFACRNASQFPLPEDRLGVWHKVSFEVLALKESAVEKPEGSGNWTWKVAFDCDLKGIEIAQ